MTEGNLSSLRPAIAESLTLLGVGYPAGLLAAEEIERRRSAELDGDELDELRTRVEELEADAEEAQGTIDTLTKERDKARDRAGELLAENTRLLGEDD